jgi:hypothetical protein
MNIFIDISDFYYLSFLLIWMHKVFLAFRKIICFYDDCIVESLLLIKHGNQQNSEQQKAHEDTKRLVSAILLLHYYSILFKGLFWFLETCFQNESINYTHENFFFFFEMVFSSFWVKESKKLFRCLKAGLFMGCCF